MLNKFYLTLLLLFTATMSFAQSSFTKQQVSEMIAESAIDCENYYSASDVQYYTEWFSRMRIVSVKSLPKTERSSMQNITTMQHRNKCNLAYSYQVADLKKFNPLMYHLHFETPSGIRYLLADSGYYLEILPKK